MLQTLGTPRLDQGYIGGNPKGKVTVSKFVNTYFAIGATELKKLGGYKLFDNKQIDLNVLDGMEQLLADPEPPVLSCCDRYKAIKKMGKKRIAVPRNCFEGCVPKWVSKALNGFDGIFVIFAFIILVGLFPFILLIQLWAYVSELECFQNFKSSCRKTVPLQDLTDIIRKMAYSCNYTMSGPESTRNCMKMVSFANSMVMLNDFVNNSVNYDNIFRPARYFDTAQDASDFLRSVHKLQHSVEYEIPGVVFKNLFSEGIHVGEPTGRIHFDELRDIKAHQSAALQYLMLEDGKYRLLQTVPVVLYNDLLELTDFQHIKLHVKSFDPKTFPDKVREKNGKFTDLIRCRVAVENINECWSKLVFACAGTTLNTRAKYLKLKMVENVKGGDVEEGGGEKDEWDFLTDHYMLKLNLHYGDFVVEAQVMNISMMLSFVEDLTHDSKDEAARNQRA